MNLEAGNNLQVCGVWCRRTVLKGVFKILFNFIIRFGICSIYPNVQFENESESDNVIFSLFN
jgi:TM2 domain-containing membrane protein YozV